MLPDANIKAHTDTHSINEINVLTNMKLMDFKILQIPRTLNANLLKQVTLLCLWQRRRRLRRHVADNSSIYTYKCDVQDVHQFHAVMLCSECECLEETAAAHKYTRNGGVFYLIKTKDTRWHKTKQSIKQKSGLCAYSFISFVIFLSFFSVFS